MNGPAQRFIDFIFQDLAFHLKQHHFLTVQIQTSDIFVLSAKKKTFNSVWKEQTEIASESLTRKDLLNDLTKLSAYKYK